MINIKKVIKKKALIVIPRIPFPLNSGGRIAIFDTLKLLSKKYELVIVIVDDNPANIGYVTEIENFSSEIYFFSKSKIRFIINSFWGLLRGKPLQVGYFYFEDVQKLINQLYIKCDLLVSFMIRTTTYGLNLPIKKIHYAIDSMYLNYKKSEANTTSMLWKMIYKVEIPLLYKTELNHIRNYNLTTFVNREESLFWKPYGKVETLPHGVEKKILEYNKTDTQYKNVIAFIGRMDYQPNIEAVMWFCNNVLQKLNPDIDFYIIGGFATPAVLSLSKQYKKVKILGFVDDPYVILKSCICTVAPMQSGGGLQTKILMAMALESVVVSTSLPIGAIECAENNVNLLIEDDPDRFASLINDIYAKAHKYEHIKKQARQLIVDHYALGVIEDKLFDLLESI